MLPILLVLVLPGCGHSDDAYAPPPRPERRTSHPPVRLVAVGDVYLGSDAEPTLVREGWDFAFRHTQALVRGADLLIGNLEAPITRQLVPVDPAKARLHRMRPASAGALTALGFDAVSLANNHVLDYGPQGLDDTVSALVDQGIRPFGAGRDVEEATDGTVIEVHGLRIGFLGFMESFGIYEDDEYAFYAGRHRSGVARLKGPAMRRAFDKMRPRVDVLIASVHWGKDFGEVNHRQREWGRRLVRYGADLVLGHHPHVAQGVEVYRGVAIVYSLGNFAFGTLHRTAPTGWRWGLSWIADVRIENARIRRIDFVPLETDSRRVGFQPRPADPAVLERTRARLNVHQGTDLEIVGGALRLRP